MDKATEPKHPFTYEDEREIQTLEWVAEVIREHGPEFALGVIERRVTRAREDIEHRETTLRQRREGLPA